MRFTAANLPLMLVLLSTVQSGHCALYEDIHALQHEHISTENILAVANLL
jgi:hypothetical protein